MLAEDEIAGRVANTETASSEGDWGELLRPRYLVSTVMLCLGVALFAFNEFFVSTAMPSAVNALGRPWLLAWVFTFYLVFAIVGGALAAYMKQRFGARVTLVAATIVFIIGTLSACFASHWSHLLIGRVLQGVGEGITIAICYALIPELFPKSLVPKVFGSEAIAWAAAAFGGPLLAGVLTEYVSWRAAFASSLPAAVIFVALVLALVPRANRSDTAYAPIPGLRLVLIGMGVLLISVSSAMTGRFVIVVLLLLAFGSFLLFVRLDRQNAHAILPRDAFSAKRLPGTGLWVILLMPLAGSAGAVYLVYGLQSIWGLGPAEAGIASAVMALSWSFVAILVASIKSMETRNRLVFSGAATQAVGIFMIAIAFRTDQFWLIYPSQCIVGVGFGLSWGTLSQLLMDRAPDSERDKTSALLPTVQSAGYAIGGAVFGLIANLFGLRDGLAGAEIRGVLLPVFVAGLLIAVISALLSYRTVRASATVTSR